MHVCPCKFCEGLFDAGINVIHLHGYPYGFEQDPVKNLFFFCLETPELNPESNIMYESETQNKLFHFGFEGRICLLFAPVPVHFFLITFIVYSTLSV